MSADEEGPWPPEDSDADSDACVDAEDENEDEDMGAGASKLYSPRCIHFIAHPRFFR